MRHIHKHFLFYWYSSGSALMDLVGVFSSIEDQHMNIVSENRQTYYSVHGFLYISFYSWKPFMLISSYRLRTTLRRTRKSFNLSRKSLCNCISKESKASIKVIISSKDSEQVLIINSISHVATSAMKKHRKKKNNAEKELKVRIHRILQTAYY